MKIVVPERGLGEGVRRRQWAGAAFRWCYGAGVEQATPRACGIEMAQFADWYRGSEADMGSKLEVRNERRGDTKRAVRMDREEREGVGKMVGERAEAGSAYPARPTTMSEKREWIRAQGSGSMVACEAGNARATGRP